MTHIMTKMLFTGLMLASTQIHAADYDFEPGLWETTWKTEIIELEAPPEMEALMRSMGNRPVYTETECIKDTAPAFDSEPDDENEGEECKTTTNRISANKMEFETSCTAPGEVTKTVGEMHFNGKTSTAKFELTSASAETSINIKSTLVGSGKYIGACD
jgi:hypothetical protein